MEFEEEIRKKKSINVEPRRSTRTRNKSKHLEDYCAIALSAENYLDEVPKSLKDIENREEKDHWKKAV